MYKRIVFLWCTLFLAFFSNAIKAQENINFQIRGFTNEVNGEAGSTLTIIADMYHNEASSFDLKIKREQNNIPSDWNTSLCLDQCFPPEINSTVLDMLPGEFYMFVMYFYTDSNTPNDGNTLISFQNLSDSTIFYQPYYATTYLSTSTINQEEQTTTLLLFPNPAKEEINLIFENDKFNYESDYTYQLFNILGKQVKKGGIESENSLINLHEFSEGWYLLSIFENGEMIMTKKIAIRH